MTIKRPIAALALACIIFAGCTKPQAPPRDILSRGMVEALLDTGMYADVAPGRIIGQHYNPSEDRWTIYACFDFMLDDGSRGSNCVDSVSAVQLDDGSWIVAVTINEVYRWRAISLLPDSGQPASGDAPPTP